jgi:hypothetical protein
MIISYCTSKKTVKNRMMIMFDCISVNNKNKMMIISDYTSENNKNHNNDYLCFRNSKKK